MSRAAVAPKMLGSAFARFRVRALPSSTAHHTGSTVTYRGRGNNRKGPSIASAIKWRFDSTLSALPWQ
jgi:hypothetical protein